MKYRKILFLILILLLMPVITYAKEGFHIKFDDDMSIENEIYGSSLIGGTNVKNNAKINGINISLGSNVEDNSNSDYAIIAGETINANGNYQNDALILGSDINVNSKINRDAFIYGNSVKLNGFISRDTQIYASHLVLNNITINGNIEIKAKTIEIKDNVKVDGIIKYNEEAEIIGDINQYKTKTYKQINNSTSSIISSNLINFANILVLYIAIVFLCPSLLKKFEQRSLSISQALTLMGKGSFLLILGPILFITLFLTKIGTYLGLLLLIIYIIIICLSSLFASYYIGNSIWNKLIKKENNMLLSGLIGIILVTLLSYVPVISIFIALLGMGLSLEIFTKNKTIK